MIVDLEHIKEPNDYLNQWVGKTIAKIDGQYGKFGIIIYFDDGSQFDIDPAESYGTPVLDITITEPEPVNG